MKRAFLLGMMMAGVLSPAFSFADTGGKIIYRGQGIGAARLGMSEAEASATLGKPDGRLHVANGYLDLFGGLQFFVGDDGRATRIETEDEAYRTPEGLGVGSTEKEIVGKLGAPAFAEDLKVRNDNLLMPQARRLCYEPGLIFVAEYVSQQKHATTHVAVRKDGCVAALAP